jgi:hypothetical protein
MAHSSDSLASRLLGLGEVVEHELVDNGRLDDLPDTLLVSTGEDDEVVGIEGEFGGGPRERMEHLFAFLHLLVCGDDLFRCALLSL